MMYRMGTKTSVYLTDDLAAAVKASPDTLADLVYRGVHVKPLLIEKDERGGFTTYWYCEVPPADARFKVLHDYWRTAAEWPIREIYEIQITSPLPDKD